MAPKGTKEITRKIKPVFCFLVTAFFALLSLIGLIKGIVGGTNDALGDLCLLAGVVVSGVLAALFWDYGVSLWQKSS